MTVGGSARPARREHGGDVAGDGTAVKVHVHNERPDLVLAYAIGLGDVT